MDARICGIGWVTGAGFGWGQRGDNFNISDLPIPLLTRKDVFPEPNQRFGRMSDYAKLGLAAITFALRDAGMETWKTKRPFSVIASTKAGCLVTDLDYNQTVSLDGGGLASPNLFAYTLANCFLGDAAIHFGLTGSSVVINETGEDCLGSLRMAVDELAMEEAEVILAGNCDLHVPGTYANDITLKPGAVFLVLALTSCETVTDYGTVSLAADGSLKHDGIDIVSLAELVQTALNGRALCQTKRNEERKMNCH